MISALACIPRGAAKARPVKDAPDEAELRQLKEQALESGGLGDMDDGSDDQDDEGGSDAEEEEAADGAAGNDVQAAVRSNESPCERDGFYLLLSFLIRCDLARRSNMPVQ